MRNFSSSYIGAKSDLSDIFCDDTIVSDDSKKSIGHTIRTKILSIIFPIIIGFAVTSSSLEDIKPDQTHAFTSDGWVEMMQIESEILNDKYSFITGGNLDEDDIIYDL